MELSDYRKQIDEIDDQITKLFQLTSSSTKAAHDSKVAWKSCSIYEKSLEKVAVSVKKSLGKVYLPSSGRSKSSAYFGSS